ncbi:DUF6426 family protein [Kitasatospora albolonga]|uniref:DUF6426 family protein n=1 Tax=Kitasatospora albolonga TaxID=68173 RepID=UPI003CD09814
MTGNISASAYSILSASLGVTFGGRTSVSHAIEVTIPPGMSWANVRGYQNTTTRSSRRSGPEYATVKETPRRPSARFPVSEFLRLSPTAGSAGAPRRTRRWTPRRFPAGDRLRALAGPLPSLTKAASRSTTRPIHFHRPPVPNGH